MSNLKIQPADVQTLTTLTTPFMTAGNLARAKELGQSLDRFLADCLWASGHDNVYPVVSKLYNEGCNDTHIRSALRHIAADRGLC